jgi:SAM-dependent methyltransferase
MKEQKDAYGVEMWDYFQGKESFEVIERDDGYLDISSELKVYFSEYPDWPDYYKEAMPYIRGRVLDVGCGAGRICLYLQEKGHEVVGIDNSPKAIDVCQQRGVEDARLCSITQVGQHLGIFDTIVMLGNNFGLFGNFKRSRWLLRRFWKMTSPEGRIVAESNDPYQTEDPDHHWYHNYNRQRGRMGGQVRMRVRHKKLIGDWFDYLLVSKKEMKMILEGTGWQATRFIDSEGSMYITVIEKTEIP